RVATTKPDPIETTFFFLTLEPDDLRLPIIARWRRFIEQRSRPDDPVFGLWHDLLALSDDEFAGQAAAVVERWKSRTPGVEPQQANPLVLDAFASATLATRVDVPRVYGELLERVYAESKESPPAANPNADPARDQVLETIASRQ